MPSNGAGDDNCVADVTRELTVVDRLEGMLCAKNDDCAGDVPLLLASAYGPALTAAAAEPDADTIDGDVSTTGDASGASSANAWRLKRREPFGDPAPNASLPTVTVAIWGNLAGCRVDADADAIAEVAADDVASNAVSFV